jgi:hypothetical protein
MLLFHNPDSGGVMTFAEAVDPQAALTAGTWVPYTVGNKLPGTMTVPAGDALALVEPGRWFWYRDPVLEIDVVLEGALPVRARGHMPPLTAEVHVLSAPGAEIVVAPSAPGVAWSQGFAGAILVSEVPDEDMTPPAPDDWNTLDPVGEGLRVEVRSVRRDVTPYVIDRVEVADEDDLETAYTVAEAPDDLEGIFTVAVGTPRTTIWRLRFVANGLAGPWSAGEVGTAAGEEDPPAPVSWSPGFDGEILVTERVEEPEEPGVGDPPPPPPPPPPLPDLTVIWVDPTQLAGGDGLTAATARSTLPTGPFTAGTRIKVRGGTTVQLPDAGFLINTSGTAEQPITLDLNYFDDWGDGPAILSGSRPIPSGWSSHTVNGATVWRVAMNPQEIEEGLIDLYQGADKFYECRFPTPANIRFPADWGRAGEFWEVPRSSRVNSTTIQIPEGAIRTWLNAAHAVEALNVRSAIMMQGEHNSTQVRNIVSYDPGTGILTHDVNNTNPVAGTVWRLGLRNHPSAMIVEGQYLRDPLAGTVDVLTFDGADPTTVEMERNGFIQWGVRLTGNHNRLLGGIIRRLNPTGAANPNRERSVISCYVSNTAERTGVHIVGTIVEDTGVCATATIHIVRYIDTIIRDIVVRRVRAYGMLASDCTRLFVVGSTFLQTGSTCLSMRRGIDSGVIGCTTRDPEGNSHANAVSIYNGNANCLFLFNDFRIVEPEVGNNVFTNHSLAQCLVAFNITMSERQPDGSSLRRSSYVQWNQESNFRLGGSSGADGIDNRYSNNVFMCRRNREGFSWRQNGNPGAWCTNNIAHGLLDTVRAPVGGAWVDHLDKYTWTGTTTTTTATSGEAAVFLAPRQVTRNVMTGYPDHLQSNRRATLADLVSWGNIDRVDGLNDDANRRAIFRDWDARDFRPSLSFATQEMVTSGEPWTFDNALVPGVSLTVNWIGRYRPDGTEAFDWRLINFANLPMSQYGALQNV